MARYTSFVLRIWSGDNGGLHGQITHVKTQAKRYFVSVDHMVKFIREQICLDQHGGACPPPEGSESDQED